MKAIVQQRYGAPERVLRLEDVDRPSVGDEEVLIRVRATSVNTPDRITVTGVPYMLRLRSGLRRPRTPVRGTDVAGVVEAVGPGVEGLAEGDHVAIHPADPCGTCPACLAGNTMRCSQTGPTSIGLGVRPGAYAELVAVGQGMCTKLPASLPLERGALAEPLAVALHGLRRSRFEPGMTGGVVGCGPIGRCSVLAARALGAGRIWASDLNPFRADLATKLGADEAGSSALTADIVVECAGARGTIDLAVGATQPGGQVVLLAVNIKGDEVYPFMWVIKEVDIVGCLGYSRAEFDEAAGWIAGGTVDVAPMITRQVSLEETDEAFFALLDGAPEGKVLVTP
jgi:threonine dehydrogenase-like Zn-dependent dehydrogenase